VTYFNIDDADLMNDDSSRRVLSRDRTLSGSGKTSPYAPNTANPAHTLSPMAGHSLDRPVELSLNKI
jgi:hypothetical protein